GAGRGPRSGMRITRFRADEQGRFTANPAPGEYFHVSAHAPQGQPYLVPQVEFAWTKGAVKKELDIRVPLGVLIHGKGSDMATGRPLPASSIQYIPVRARDDSTVLSGSQAIVASRDDGSFRIAIPPGRGHLAIYGPTGDYVAYEVGRNTID